jgi:hypothetical protein
MDLEIDVLQELGKKDVLDAHGRRFRMADFWLDRRAAMVFVRHFG